MGKWGNGEGREGMEEGEELRDGYDVGKNGVPADSLICRTSSCRQRGEFDRPSLRKAEAASGKK